MSEELKIYLKLPGLEQAKAALAGITTSARQATSQLLNSGSQLAARAANIIQPNPNVLVPPSPNILPPKPPPEWWKPWAKNVTLTREFLQTLSSDNPFVGPAKFLRSAIGGTLGSFVGGTLLLVDQIRREVAEQLEIQRVKESERLRQEFDNIADELRKKIDLEARLKEDPQFMRDFWETAQREVEGSSYGTVRNGELISGDYGQ